MPDRNPEEANHRWLIGYIIVPVLAAVIVAIPTYVGLFSPDEEAKATLTPTEPTPPKKETGAMGSATVIDENLRDAMVLPGELNAPGTSPESAPEPEPEPVKPESRPISVEKALAFNRTHTLCGGRAQVRFLPSVLAGRGAPAINLEVPMERPLIMNETVSIEGCSLTFLRVERAASEVAVFRIEWTEDE